MEVTVADLVLGLLLVVAFQKLWEFMQAAQEVKQQKEKLVEELVKEIEQSIPVKVEMHHGCFYFFHSETDQFIVQGHNREEVVTAFKARYGSRHRLAVDSEDPVIQKFLGNTKDKIEII